jgi:hypothetical protein
MSTPARVGHRATRQSRRPGGRSKGLARCVCHGVAAGGRLWVIRRIRKDDSEPARPTGTGTTWSPGRGPAAAPGRALRLVAATRRDRDGALALAPGRRTGAGTVTAHWQRPGPATAQKSNGSAPAPSRPGAWSRWKRRGPARAQDAVTAGRIGQGCRGAEGRPPPVLLAGPGPRPPAPPAPRPPPYLSSSARMVHRDSDELSGSALALYRGNRAAGDPAGSRPLAREAPPAVAGGAYYII